MGVASSTASGAAAGAPLGPIGIGVGAAIGFIGGIMSGRAQKKAGEAQKRAAYAQADLADYNAAVADLQASDALERGRIEEARFRKTVEAVIGAQRAGTAAGNIDVGFGSAVDIQADATLLGELDALTIRSNAMREAWGQRVHAADLRTRADISRKEGVMLQDAANAQATATYFGAAASLATTTGSLLMSKYGWGGSGGSI